MCAPSDPLGQLMPAERSMVPEAGVEPARLLGRGIFMPLRLSPPARLRCSWSGARLHHSTAYRARCHRCPPSALYTFPGSQAGAWLGVSSDAFQRPGPSPSLTGFTFGVSTEGLNVSSPLCLPISPLGHGAIQCACTCTRHYSISFSTGQTLSSIRGCAFAVGWTRSDWNQVRSSAKPSSRKGTRATFSLVATRPNMSLNWRA